MEMCSKPLSIFVHGFNLLFLFWFINCRIRCAWRLCYCCCPLAVCLDQLWLILPRVDWTLQMSAYNLLIPFISGLLLLPCVSARVCVCLCVCVCVCVCVWGRVCQRQMGVGGCVYVLEMSRSNLHWSLRPAEWGKGWGALVCWLPLHFIPHSFSLWYFLTYARSILSLSLSLSFVSHSSLYPLLPPIFAL